MSNLEEGSKNYYGGEKCENEVEDNLTFLGFKEQHNGFVL
jgi:hypothetical protein